MAEAVANWYTTTSPGCATLGVREDGHGLGRGVVVDGVDEDLRADAAGPGGVAQPQGVAAHGVASVQDGDEVVDPAHEGAAADRAMRRSCPVPSGSGRHLDETRTVQQELPGRLVQRAAVDQILGGGVALPPRPPRARRPRRAGAPRRSTRRLWASSGSSAWSGRRSTTPLSTTPPGEPSGRDARYSDASAMVTEQPCSMARSATAPRGSTPCASAPRPRKACSRSPSPQSAWTMVAARRARQHVRRDGPGQRTQLAGWDEPGRALHGPVLGGQPRLERGDAGRQETKGLDHVAHGLFELGPLAFRRPARSGPCAGRRRSRGPVLPAVAAARGERVGQRRGAGVVRAVAIAEMRERRQEVPGVAALRRQPREGLVQRCAPPGPGPSARASPALVPAPSRVGLQRRLEGRLRTWRTMLPAWPPGSGAALLGRGDERLPSAT